MKDHAEDADARPSEAADVADTAAEHARAMQDARTLLDAGMVAELVAETHRLATSVERLAANLVGNNARLDELIDLRRRNRRLVAAVIAGAATLLLVSASLAVVGLVFLDRLSGISRDATNTSRAVAECTSPAPPPAEALDADDRVHECYDQARERQRENVANLDRAAIDSVICGSQHVDPAAIAACYEARREARRSTTTAADR